MKHIISKKELTKEIDNTAFAIFITAMGSLISILIFEFALSIIFLILCLGFRQTSYYYKNKYNVLYVYNNPHVRTKMKELNSK